MQSYNQRKYIRKGNENLKYNLRSKAMKIKSKEDQYTIKLIHGIILHKNN